MRISAIVMGRKRVRLGLAMVGIVSLVAVSGCTGWFSPPGMGQRNQSDSDSAGGILISSLRPKDSADLRNYYGQKLTWRSCAHGLRCSSVKVPIDWQHVDEKSIRIAIVEHRAAGTSLGALLVNPGGPGGSGVELIEDSVENAVTSGLAKRYDVVGFDPRGVGASSGVRCYGKAGTDSYLYGIDQGKIGSAQWIAAQKRKSSELAAACELNTGAVLGHLDTVNAAADMDVIRAALGQKKLNYLGYSYGTYLGTVYAGLYPKLVGRMVFDGADDPWGTDFVPSSPGASSDDFSVAPSIDSAVAQAQSFEDALTTYLESCLTNAIATVGNLRCPFLTSVRDAKSRVAGFLSAVARAPLLAKDGRKLGASALATAIIDPLYDRTEWPDLTEMFLQVEDGNPAIAFALADEYNDREPDGSYDDNAELAGLAIGCDESGADVDLKFDKREITELRKVAPILGIYQAYGDLVCSGWRFGPSPFPNPIHAAGTGPILVIGVTGDPATPYSDAEALASQLNGGHLITMHGTQHTAYALGNACIDDTVDSYFIDGTVPAHDPDC